MSKSEVEALAEMAALRNLGPVSAELLWRFGLRSAAEVLAADAYLLFADLQEFSSTPLSKNLLRALLGAQQDLHFAQVQLRASASHAGDPQSDAKRESVLRELRQLPNIGPTMAEHLWRAGIRSIAEFERADLRKVFEAMKIDAPVQISNPHLRALRGARLGVEWNDERTKRPIEGESEANQRRTL